MLEIAEISMATHFRMVHPARDVSLSVITRRQHWKATGIAVVVATCWFRWLLLRISRRGGRRRLVIELLWLWRLKNIRCRDVSNWGRCLVLWWSWWSWWLQFSLWQASGFIGLVLLIHHTARGCGRELCLWTTTGITTKRLLLLLLVWIETAITVVIVGLECFSRIEVPS